MDIWKRIFEGNPDIEELCWIISNAPEEYKAKAWEQLEQILKQADIVDANWILSNLPEEYKAKVKEIIMMAEGYKALAEEHHQFAIMVLPLANEVLPEWN